jgi:crossover junction endodeoxyribonuclease RuvC
MSFDNFVGIDPGKTGAAVALDDRGIPVDWVAANHPDEGYANGGVYWPTRMADWLREVKDTRGGIALAVLEKQQARPMEGRSSILTTGRGQGLWEGALSALGIPFVLVPPATWTRAIFGSMPKGTDRKARAVETSLSRLPALELTWGRRRKPHDGLADAGCLALYAIKQRADRHA